jgi:hypothetical protein
MVLRLVTSTDLVIAERVGTCWVRFFTAQSEFVWTTLENWTLPTLEK